MWVIRNSYVNAADSAIESQLFQSLSALVLRHHPHSGEHLDKNSTEETMETLVDVLNVLQQAAAHGVPQPEEGRPKVQAQPSMERVKNAFEGEIARVSALSEEKTMGSTDIEMIDMVGLLFDYILNDDLMPDSVKALLSHLHTPYLKIALLNKDFFVREEHPARKLLNAITQAGSRCPSDDPNDLNVVTKIQSIVNQILDNFSDNTDIFTELLDDFSTFIENLERRSNIMEQRSVEAVEGQEKLHEARRLVSEEIIKRCSELKRPPKVLQELLLNTWAHSLVITLLRNGKKSTEWREALAVTDALIWSVKPKKTESEREMLRVQLPVIAETVRAGLAFGGSLEADINEILDQLSKCSEEAMMGRRPVDSAMIDDEMKVRKTEANSVSEMRATIFNGEVDHDEDELDDSAMAEVKDIMTRIKQQEMGTWFEFYDYQSGQRQRGKLAWFNQKTMTYMFVNQSGRQVAVRSCYDLAKGVVDGNVKIIPTEKEPFITRAFQGIFRKLKSSDEEKQSA